VSLPGKSGESGPDAGTPAGATDVAILGYGRFGQALAQLAQEAGLTTVAYDPAGGVPDDLAVASPGHLAARAQQVVLAVPTEQTRNALWSLEAHLTPEHLVIDVGSVKHGAVQALNEVLGQRVPWVATHPLFGSSSVALGERPLLAVVCPNGSHPQAAGRARKFYERIGCVVAEQDAAEHDRAMARSHALAFFVAKALIDMQAGQDLPFTPPSFRAMARTIEMVRIDAAHLFVTIERENPYAAASRQEFLDALARIHSQLEALGTAREGNEGRQQSLQIPDLGTHSPELMATRDLIDEIDRDLVRLLARRAQLSRRAGSIKASHGRSIRDPERERTLLEQRRQWASECNLEPEAIADIFAAVLRYSRILQAN
jgi:prephenate dehydrogenase